MPPSGTEELRKAIGMLPDEPSAPMDDDELVSALGARVRQECRWYVQREQYREAAEESLSVHVGQLVDELIAGMMHSDRMLQAIRAAGGPAALYTMVHHSLEAVRAEQSGEFPFAGADTAEALASLDRPKALSAGDLEDELRKTLGQTGTVYVIKR